MDKKEGSKIVFFRIYRRGARYFPQWYGYINIKMEAKYFHRYI